MDKLDIDIQKKTAISDEMQNFNSETTLENQFTGYFFRTELKTFGHHLSVVKRIPLNDIESICI